MIREFWSILKIFQACTPQILAIKKAPLGKGAFLLLVLPLEVTQQLYANKPKVA